MISAWRWLRMASYALIFITLMLVALPATAQTSTPITTEPGVTATASFTPTTTPTPTANLYVIWTLQPMITTTGTPGIFMPGQEVALRYEMSVDGVIISVLLFGIFVLLLLMIVIYFLKPNNTQVK